MSDEDASGSEPKASLELLYSISREIAGQLDLSELLTRVLQLTMKKVGGVDGSILALDEKGKPAEGALAYDGEVHEHTAGQLADTLAGGLAGWVVEHGQAAQVSNTLQDPRWLRRPGQKHDRKARSAISVPLWARERVVGVLTIVHRRARQLGQDEVVLLTAIAEQAGIAIENARLFAAEQQRHRLASTLQEIAHVISSTLDPDQVLPQVLEQLERVVDCDSSSILLLEDDQLRAIAARGFKNLESAIGTTFPLAPHIVAAQVLSSRRTMVVADVQEVPGWEGLEPLGESRNVHGWICAPLVVRERAVGVLSVNSHRVGAYGPNESEVVTAFADHAATAVANAQWYARSQQQLQASRAMADAARAVTASLNLDEVLQRILAYTMRALGAEATSVALVEHDAGELEVKVAMGSASQTLAGTRFRLGEGIAGWVAENDQVVVVPDARADGRFSNRVDGRGGTETWAVACAPIRVQDRVIGVLEVMHTQPRALSTDHVDLLVGISGLAGTAIAHAQLFAETQAARHRYWGLFEDSVTPILITDLAGVIADANQRAESFLGHERRGLCGKPIDGLYRDASPEALQTLRGMAPGDSVSFEALATRSDGNTIPVEMHIKRIDVDGQPCQQWMLLDVSERKELDRFRSELTSMIFHDMQSPLGNVTSCLEMLEGLTPPGDGKARSVVSIAQRSCRRVSRLLDSLLDVERLESGKAVLDKRSADMSAVVREAIEEVGPIAEAKGHQVELRLQDDLPRVEIDMDMVSRVVINLLENAVKYTPEGGRILVEARSLGREVVTSVRDNGPGIPLQDQERIFERFFRLHRDQRAKGLGLGLPFCRLAVEAHGGRLWVESGPGEGAVFSFTLPIGQPIRADRRAIPEEG